MKLILSMVAFMAMTTQAAAWTGELTTGHVASLECGAGGQPCKYSSDCCGSRNCVTNGRFKYCDWLVREAPYGAMCRVSMDCAGSMGCDSDLKVCR